MVINNNTLISVSCLTKTYSSNGISNNVLNNLSLDINKNELSFLIGANGCGKTTLLKILSNHEKADNDFQLVVSGKIVSQIDNNDIIYFPQNIEDALSGSLKVSEFLSLFNKTEIKRIFDNFDNPELIEVFSQNTYKSKLIQELSIGQKQILLAIALLSKNGYIYFFDEIFSAMDKNNRSIFIEFLKKIIIKDNCCAIIVSHDIDMALSYADSILLLNDGNISKMMPSECNENELLKNIHNFSK
jgi:ABC-type Mn2+/Zn2+ transport system ATPase subunit